MKNKTNLFIYPLVLMGMFLMLANGCKKDDNTNPSTNKQTGNIKVSLTYDKTQSGFVYWIDGTIKVDLIDNNSGTCVATQYLSLGTSDLGTYNYGDYKVQASATEKYTRLSDGYNGTHPLSGFQYVTLNSPTVSVNIHL